METSISNAYSPNSFPQAVLLNCVIRVGLTGKGTLLGDQGSHSKFELWASPLDLCNPQSVIQRNNIELGIGIKILVFVPQTRSSRI